MIDIASLPKKIEYQGTALDLFEKSDNQYFYIGYRSGKISGIAFIGKFLKSDPQSEKSLQTFLLDICERFKIKVAENKSKKFTTMDSTKTIAQIIAELQAVDTTALDVVVAAINQAVTDLQALPASPAAPAAPTATSVTITFSDETTQTVPAPAASV